MHIPLSLKVSNGIADGVELLARGTNSTCPCLAPSDAKPFCICPRKSLRRHALKNMSGLNFRSRKKEIRTKMPDVMHYVGKGIVVRHDEARRIPLC